MMANKPIPVAELSNSRACGLSLAGIADSNPAEGIEVPIVEEARFRHPPPPSPMFQSTEVISTIYISCIYIYSRYIYSVRFTDMV